MTDYGSNKKGGCLLGIIHILKSMIDLNQK